MHMPNVQMVINKNIGKLILKFHPKLTTVISRNINHKPRFKRKTDNSFLVFFCPMIYAEVPASNMNIGAQKCVIQRVKNIGTFVFSRSSGSNKNDPEKR